MIFRSFTINRTFYEDVHNYCDILSSVVCKIRL